MQECKSMSSHVLSSLRQAKYYYCNKEIVLLLYHGTIFFITTQEKIPQLNIHINPEYYFSASDVIPHDRTRIPIFAQRAFPLQPRAFPLQPRAFPPQPRNQASKTKCQHSSSLISSIKKRNLYFLKELHYRRRELNPVVQRSSY